MRNYLLDAKGLIEKNTEEVEHELLAEYDLVTIFKSSTAWHEAGFLVIG